MLSNVQTPAALRAAPCRTSGALLPRCLPLGCSTRRTLLLRCAASAAAATTYTSSNGSSGNGAAADTATPAPIAAAAVVALPPSPSSPPAFLPGPDAYAALAADGGRRAAMSAAKLFLMGVYGGAYVAFGALFSVAVVGGCPGLAATNPGLAKLLFALLFPAGLFMNLTFGGELFTANAMKMPITVLERNATLAQLAKSWACSYFGNAAGCVVVLALVLASGVLAGPAASALPAKIAAAKCALPWTQAFVRAVLANWLVCFAVWVATAAPTLGGKAVAIWPPITAFVAIGLEHSVANMFLIPLGILLGGANVTLATFLTANLLPVTAGNVVGGLLFMGLGTSALYGRLAAKA